MCLEFKAKLKQLAEVIWTRLIYLLAGRKERALKNYAIIRSSTTFMGAIMREKPLPSVPHLLASNLHKAWHTITLRQLPAQIEQHIQKQKLALAEFMRKIIHILRNKDKSDFFDLFSLQLSIWHLIVNFMTILEFAKVGGYIH